MSSIEVAQFTPSDWEKGTRGRLDPGTTSLPRLKDLRFCQDGMLRPRPLWDYKWNNEDDTSLNSPEEIAGPWWLGAYKGDTDPDVTQIFFVLENSSNLENVYMVNPTTGALTDASSVVGSAAATNLDVWGNDFKTLTRIDNNRYLLMDLLLDAADPDYGSGSWPSGPEVVVTSAKSALQTRFGVSSFQCWGSTVYKGRAFYYGQAYGTSGPGRIYYSDLYDYAVFTSAAQYFDVDGRVLGMIPLGSTCFIWTDTASWYAFNSGGDPALGTLRYIGQQTIPKWQWTFTSSSDPQDNARGSMQPRVMDGRAYFISQDNDLCVLMPDGTVDDDSFKHIGAAHSLVTDPANDILMVRSDESENKFYRLQYGVWTEENVYTTASPSPAIPGSSMDLAPALASTTEYLRIFDAEPIGSENNMYVYSRDINEDNLPSADGSVTYEEETYVLVDAQLWCPRIRVPGKRVRVREVQVDMELEGSDGTGAVVKLELQGPTETATFANTGAYGTEWEANYNDSGRAGKNVRKIFSTLGPFQSYTDVVLTGLRHVAIQSVTVIYEISKDRLM